MDNRCVCCGEIIPEGTMICPSCSKKSFFTLNNTENQNNIDNMQKTDDKTTFMSDFSK